MKDQPEKPEPISFEKATYRKIRTAIGYMGIGLPIVLLIFTAVRPDVTLQLSISDYYFTHLREILTGTLCAVGLFLIHYQGFSNDKWYKNDKMLTNLAGFMAFGIALFPTIPDPLPAETDRMYGYYKVYTLVNEYCDFLGSLHFIFAGIFFAITALLCLVVFPIGQADGKAEKIKSRLNEIYIYRVCGVLIILSLIAIPVFNKWEIISYPILKFEVVMLTVFGIAWLIKGRAFGYKGKWGMMVYNEDSSKPNTN